MIVKGCKFWIFAIKYHSIFESLQFVELSQASSVQSQLSWWRQQYRTYQYFVSRTYSSLAFLFLLDSLVDLLIAGPGASGVPIQLNGIDAIGILSSDPIESVVECGECIVRLCCTGTGSIHEDDAVGVVLAVKGEDGLCIPCKKTYLKAWDHMEWLMWGRSN